MVRLILGIVVGYAFFALTAALVFTIPGRDPHAPADPFFMVGSIGAGAIAALAGGYFGAAIAKGHERPAGIAIALIVAGAAIASLIAQPGQGARWSQRSAPVTRLRSPDHARATARSRRSGEPNLSAKADEPDGAFGRFCAHPSDPPPPALT